ncbi:hypothetical protein AWENTII_004551 [Aspergillus wentii]
MLTKPSDTKEKPFSCDKCPKSFTRKDLLARHERLFHTSTETDPGSQSQIPYSSPSSHTNEGLGNRLAALGGNQMVSPISIIEGEQRPNNEHFPSGFPAPVNQTPLMAQRIPESHPSSIGPQDMVTMTEFNPSLGGFGLSTPYGDDFTSFLDSIPLPSHPFSPAYQPLPLFPAFPIFPQPDYSQSSEGGREVEGPSTPSSSVLPRHGTQLPSLQPEGTHNPYRAHQLKGFVSVTDACRDRIVTLLSGYSNVLSDLSYPSRHALSRYFTGYVTGFHDHYPFMHIPTLDINSISVQLFCSMTALGAQYCREPEASMSLYQVARAVTLEHIRREFQSATEIGTRPGTTTWLSASAADNRDLFETLQATVLLMAVSAWFKDNPPHYDAWSLRSYMETLARMGGFNYLPVQDGSWESWIRRETVKRTKLIAFCFLNINTVVFDLPAMILTEDIGLDLPCTEKEWQATSASLWLEERRQSAGEPKLQDALASLYAHTENGQGCLESFSSLGGYVLIHAIIQHIWSIQKTRRLPIFKGNSLSTPEINSLEQALERWCQCWERNKESSVDPLNPHGPLSFTSAALLRLAYIRLNADFSSARQLQTWDPEAIARSLKENLSVQRSDRMTRAALHCAHALSTPIRLGINFVAHSQAVLWSNQHALCSLECAVLLAKWLEAVTVTHPSPSLTEQETKLLDFVIEMVMEAQHGVGRDWLLQNNARLSASVTRLWARLFTADYIWEIVSLIGQALNSYANLVEKAI